MKPSEIIDKALADVIPDVSKWTQGLLYDSDDRCCMAGAMMVSAKAAWTDGFGIAPRYHSAEYKNYLAARRACLDAINEQHGEMTVPHFNDTHTYDEVRAMMEKARAGLQERGE